MRILMFGATGMVGSGVLKECLEDPRVTSVLVISRTPGRVSHTKLREILHSDFFDYTPIRCELADHDACFFCLGVSAAGKSESDYRRLTYDLTMAAAHALVEASPAMTFCYVSGAGTDSTERGRIMWARIKGKTENDLLRLPFRAGYMFRPGYIQPLRGVRSQTTLYQMFYNVLAPLYPLLRRVFPRHVTTTVNVGRAMIRVASDGYDRSVITSADINALAARTG